MKFKVIKDYRDDITGKEQKVGDIIEIESGRINTLKDFIKPVKKEIETEMLNSGEKAILPRPKNKERIW